MFVKIFFFVAALAVTGSTGVSESDSDKFPPDFSFGVASAAYQTEGAWNIDGKGPSVWDDFTHNRPDKIRDHSNGDVAGNSYEFYLDDIEAMKSIGMKHYRFSIAWARVLPDGDTSKVNEKGIEYYNKLINKLLEYNIQPMVTMYHWDLPSKLQRFGGFASDAIVDYFEDYAKLLYDRFGDRVKYWITINEPSVFCVSGYANDFDAPGVDLRGIGEYLCGHNALKAHAVAYRLYEKSYKSRYNGKVGIVLNSLFYFAEAGTGDEIVDRALSFSLGWFADPIFNVNGGYPPIMVERIRRNSQFEGRLRSRLPEFSNEWKEKIRGSADFLGLNYYTSRVVRTARESNTTFPSSWHDRNIDDIILPEWKKSVSNWLYSVPDGLRGLLNYIKEVYGNPLVIITENGWTDRGEIEDNGRAEYTRDHLIALRDAIVKDKCNVGGYTAWCIVDEFEWRDGYTETFGLFKVNFTSPRKERSPKKSAAYLKKVTETYQVPELD